MSLPYFPMFPSDFEAKTSHLTLAEDGAYNRLLRICWMTPGCTIPDDEAWIMRRVRAHTEADKEAVLAILSEYFTAEDGRYSNAKLIQIWVEANEAHKKRVSAGSKGGKAKSLKTNDTGSSNAIAKPKQPEPEPEPNNKTPKPPKGDAALAQILGKVCSSDVAVDFVQHRRAIKAPMTEVAAERIAKKLEGHASPDAVLSQSIENGWKGVFPEKVEGNQVNLFGRATGPRVDESQRLRNIAAMIEKRIASGVTASQARECIQAGLVTPDQCKGLGLL